MLIWDDLGLNVAQSRNKNVVKVCSQLHESHMSQMYKYIHIYTDATAAAAAETGVQLQYVT